jgi:hypothetical protein
MSYLPQPPRAWSRVQNACTFINPNDNYTLDYSVLVNRQLNPATANYLTELINKGNVLQYKANSAQLSKKQKYSQLAKGFGPNRTKVFATQSTTYTNPNTTGLLRVASTSIPYPNILVGQPNNPSGPYQPNVPSPFDCSNNGILEDGGHLVCGTYINPCSQEIVKQSINNNGLVCNPSFCSDVPGRPINLCWDKSIQPWYPKPRYIMNNSTNKWPINYKGLVSAIKPQAPTIQLNGLVLTWTNINNCQAPVSSFNIFVNNTFFTSVSYTITSYTFINLNNNDSIYMTSVSTTIESDPSNIVIFVETFTTSV